ncbi:hypothetical protein [Pontibacter sp. G13]|uniref:hypothetical protein n=1 Tax=Pontibacter sp. G13 TaxID=3074898 RepID=UPI00288A03EA|nr:hypothetical protein [Pontibacter sp. G13]WNJ17181.1 hypothetical protein RJD25_20180 [Pontibacter sp. G13]
MRRIHLPQFTSASWFPAPLKTMVDEFLQGFIAKIGADKPFLPLIHEAMEQAPNKQLVDIRAEIGSGIPGLVEHIREQGWTYESTDNWNPHLQRGGVVVVASGFHRLNPQQARQWLQSMVDQDQTVLVLEGNNNNWWQAVGMLVFVPLSVLLISPIIKPFRMGRMLFTYLLPILPIVICLDGVMALFKLYGPKDLAEVAEGVSSEDMAWGSGKMDNGRGGKIMYLIGYQSA